MPVLDFQETPDGPTLIMPYYEKGNLDKYGYVSDDLCVTILLQLLRGLSHLHERGVVHRDLKLANLLVDKPFNIVIADFGLSKFAENKLFTSFCGTITTTAPEVFPRAGASSYGIKADVWSAAVTIMQLYLNRLPTPPDTDLYEKSNELYKWNEKWCELLLEKLRDENENGDQVIDLLLCMLEPDPEKRLSAEECLQRGCGNGLFRRSHDGDFVPAAETTLHFGLDDDGARTPTQQWHKRSGAPTPSSFQWAQAGRLGLSLSNPSEVSTLLPHSIGAATPRLGLPLSPVPDRGSVVAESPE